MYTYTPRMVKALLRAYHRSVEIVEAGSDVQGMDYDGLASRLDLQRALRGLTPTRFAAVYRYYVEGWTPERIAGVLGCTEERVRELLTTSVLALTATMNGARGQG